MGEGAARTKRRIPADLTTKERKRSRPWMPLHMHLATGDIRVAKAMDLTQSNTGMVQHTKSNVRRRGGALAVGGRALGRWISRGPAWMAIPLLVRSWFADAARGIGVQHCTLCVGWFEEPD